MSTKKETEPTAAEQPTVREQVTDPAQKNVAKSTARQRAELQKFSLGMKIMVTLVYGGIALGVAVYLGYGPYLRENWLMLVGGLTAALLTLFLIKTGRWFERAKAQQRMGAIIIFAVLVILAFFVLVFVIPLEYQAAVLRLIFITVVCTLPAVMYYLFIATKKNSLLNELTINLVRLGLLEPDRVPAELQLAGLAGENQQERENRIKTYVQKFESVYGSVPTYLSTFLLNPTDPGQSTGNRRIMRGDAAALTNFTFDTVLPVLLATLLIALGWLITLPPWEGRLEFWKTSGAVEIAAAEAQDSPAVAAEAEGKPKAATATDKWVAVFSPIKSPVRFAFIGAYFFALQLLFRRYVRRDLRASAYVAVSLRIILAVLGVWVLAAAIELMPERVVGAKESEQFANTLLVGAFVVGVFPRVLWQVLQAGLKKQIGARLAPNLNTQLPISDLDGLTVWHEARFEEEDIENIPNMATADIVDMMINTRFPPDRIIDWVDQAILFTHIGQDGKDSRRLLRAHGIRTASALVEAYNQSELHQDRSKFETILPGEGRHAIRSLVDAVGTNPNLKLIQTWRGLMPHTHKTPAEQRKPEPAEPHKAAEKPPDGGKSAAGGQPEVKADAEAEVSFPAELQLGNGK